MYDLKTAEKLLIGENLTLLVYSGDQVIKSSERGVMPLLKLIDRNQSLKGFTAVDKVVGKAAAYLYCILQVDSVHALTISKSAKQVLENFNVKVSYNCLADYIINRKGNGKCPMESAVETCENRFDALNKIKQKLKELNS